MPERSTDLGRIEIPKLELPKGGGALRGIDEKFMVNASNGTASMSILVPLTPNRDGFTPSCSLTYSSGAGNGPFGLGWKLDLPYIQRRSEKRLPRYLAAPDEDVFIISGAEDLVPLLVETAPGTWQTSDVTTGSYRVRAYRPRIAGDFARIERISHPAHGEYWQVIDGSNVVTIFGRNPLARIADPADASRIFCWLPEFRFDDRGNWVLYEYKAEDATNMPATSAEANRRAGVAPFVNLYPKRIRYGNHAPYPRHTVPAYDPPLPADRTHHFQVVFDYGEHDAERPTPQEVPGQTWPYRADAFSSYRSGFEIRTARLCRRILMFHDFPQEALGADALVGSMDMIYEAATVNGIGQADVVHLTQISRSGYVRRADGSYSRKAIPPLLLEYQPVVWSDTIQDASAEALVDAPVGIAGDYRLVDLFGEGVAGILCEVGSDWIYKVNRGPDDAGRPTFERGKIVAPRPRVTGLKSGSITLEDLAGSGERQIVVNGPQLSGFYGLASDGTWDDFVPFRSATNIDLRDPSVRRIDLTGDGTLEIVVAEQQAFVWYAANGKDGFGAAERALQSLDEEKGPVVVFVEGEQTIFLADMNGDGLTDIVRIRNGEIVYWPNLGYGRFGAKVAMSATPHLDDPASFDPRRVRLADISGSGTADLLYLGSVGATAWLNQAGNGYSDPFPLPAVPTTAPGTSFDIADLLGQGTPCLIWSSVNRDTAGPPFRYIDLMGGRKPHLLTRVVNNLGKETRLEYRSSTRYYQDDHAAGTPWATRLPFPVQVISRQTLQDQVTGAQLVSAYTYHHGFWDPEEKEFRGFGRVDRTDAEDYDTWQLSADGTTAAESQQSFQPPMLTRTWYHLGAWFDDTRILTQFASEYWQAAYVRAFPAAPALPAEPALPDGRLVAAATVLDPTIMDRLPAEERREALRACKGLVLRQEIFALDAPAIGATEADLERQMTPYTVDTHTCHIQLLQPRGPNPYGVYVVAEDEGLHIDYERRADDARIRHGINLELDELGKILQKANINYGRDPVRAAAAADAIAGSASDFAGVDDGARARNSLSDAMARTEGVQSRTRLTVTRALFTNDIDLPTAWRIRRSAQTETFEINGLLPGAALFSRADLTGILDDPKSTAIPFEASPGPGITRRPMERQRTLYYDEAAAAPLALGSMASHGLVWQGQVCAFPASLPAARYGGRLADPAASLPQGAYVHSGGDADWWIPTGTVRYADPGDTVATLRARFFRPVGHIDSFGAETRVTYYKDYFLLLQSVADPVGNRTGVEQFDFRTMQPVLLRDPNDVLTAAISDELALVTALAFLGKDLDGDGTPELEMADDLTGLASDTSGEAATVAALFAAADSVALEPQARLLLRRATMRFVYDLDAWITRGEPAAAVTITRERHASADPAAPLHIIFEYTDGSGAVAMTKAQAEPGPASSASVAADGSVTISDVDTAAQVPPRLRWIGNGRLVLNNKGRPVRRYEPYFSVSPRYESLPELVANGVSATLTYDPPGRLVRIDLPDGTIQRTEFDIWQTVTWDPGDTVLEGRWHSDRKNRLIDAELIARGCDPAREAAAAVQAEAFADTPTTALLDPLGRPVLGLSHAGFDAVGNALLFPTTLLLDVAGNVLQVLDARGNTPAAFEYDMVGRRIVQHSMDGGSRWTLPTTTNLPLLRWDERNHALTYQYDALQRETGLHVTGGDAAAPLDNQVMHAVYGEGQPDDRLHGLRGRMYRRWDTAGRLEWSSFDGKGNLLAGTRRFAADYRVLVDWSGDLEAPLEAETHTTTYSYDAVNRLIDTTLPDGSRTTRRYTPANLLGRVDAQSPGGPVETIVAAVTYDERGRRAAIKHGNGARTEYRYDPDSFRLIGLQTRQVDGSVVQDLAYTHDCGGNLTDLEDRAQPTVFFDNHKLDALSHFTCDPLYRLVSAEGREHAGQQGSFGPQDNWNDNDFIVRHQPGDAMAWRSYTQNYRWDAVGNLRRLAHAAGAGSYTRTYDYEAATNRLTSTAIGADIYAYDHHPAHGFIRQMPHLAVMQYDFLDRLSASSRQAVDAGTPETTWYIYDHDGKRLRKVTDRAAAAGAMPAMKEDRRYLGALEIFRSQTGATAGLQRTTVHIMDGARRFAMIDQRNAVDDGTPDRVVRYQFSNHLGSAVLELDAMGRALAYEEYHPFGTTAYQATDATLEVAARRYRYCGLERDEESGLAMHGVRYYGPWLGRWTQPDPAGLKDGIDDYAYCSGNPLRMTDPGGCDGWDRFFGGVKMVGGALETVSGGAMFLGGCAASEIGVGIPVAIGGAAVTAHGADVAVSGFRTMWNGEQVDTVTSQVLQEHTSLTRSQANMVDAGVSIVGSFGASAVTRAPSVAAGLRGAAAADDAAANSVTLAFKPGLPTGHSMVGVTSKGTTVWTDLRVARLANSGTADLRYVQPGTAANIAVVEGGPSASYLTVTVPRTAAQVEAAQQVAQEAVTLGKAGTYSYLGNNCTTYATSVLRAADVAAPPTTPMVSFVTTALQSPSVVQPVVAASVATNATVGVRAAMQPDNPPVSAVDIGPDPSVVSAPAVSTPVDTTPAPADSTTVSSQMDDPGAPICAAEGYYNDVEQVCYSQ